MCVDTPPTFARAVSDGGCLGELVCGERIADRVLRRLAGAVETECSKAVYVFGGGTAKCTRSWNVVFYVAGRKVSSTLDVVAGSLPLLAGRSLLRRLGAQEDFAAGQLWVKVNGEYAVGGTTQAGADGLMMLRLDASDTAVPVLASKVVKEKSNQCVEADALSSGTTEVESGDGESSDGDDECQWGPWGGDGDEAVPGAEPGISEGQLAARVVDFGAKDLDTGASGKELGDGWMTVSRRRSAKGGPPSSKKETRPASNSFEHLGPASSCDRGDIREEQATAQPAGPRPSGAPRLPRRPEQLHEQQEAETFEGLEADVDLPKVLKLTDKQILQDHRRGHRSAKAQFDFYCGTVNRTDRQTFSREFSQLFERIKHVRRDCCKGCCLREPRIKPGTVIPRNLQYLDRIWLDLVSLSSKKNWWCLGIVDEATGDSALQFMVGKDAAQVQHAYLLRWASIRGAARSIVVSDGGKEFVSKDFVELSEKLGQQKEVTPAYSSESHGRIEVLFRSMRWSLDRIHADQNKTPKIQKDWEVLLAFVENSLRNEVLHGGYSSSQRAWGRGTSLSVAAQETTVAIDSTPQAESVEKILELQRVATEAHWKTRCDRALRAIRSEKVRPEVRDYQVGEQVYYRRSAKNSSKSVWHGIGTVAAITKNSYRVEHGGHLVVVGKHDLKGAGEFYLGENTPVFSDAVDEEIPDRQEQNPKDEMRAQPTEDEIEGETKVNGATPQAETNEPQIPKEPSKWHGHSADRAAAVIGAEIGKVPNPCQNPTQPAVQNSPPPPPLEKRTQVPKIRRPLGESVWW